MIREAYPKVCSLNFPQVIWRGRRGRKHKADNLMLSNSSYNVAEFEQIAIVPQYAVYYKVLSNSSSIAS
jgi:hypothetical protein